MQQQQEILTKLELTISSVLCASHNNDPLFNWWRGMDMAVEKGKGKGKKKNKEKKANDILKSILASVEAMSAKLVKLEQKIDSFELESKRQGQRGQKGGTGPLRSAGATGTGRGQRVAKKKSTTRKKSVAGKAVGKKVATKKAAAKKKVTGKKAVSRKKTVKRRATTRKVAPKKTRAKR
jgi:hypothetical protein